MKTILTPCSLKPTLAVLLLIFLPGSLFSQNIIRLKTGQEYKVNILNKTKDTLTYKPVGDKNVTYLALMTDIDTIKPDKPWLYCTGPLSPEDQLWKQIYHYKRARITGITLLSSGLAFVVVGGVLWPEYHADGGFDEAALTLHKAFSVMLMAIGTAGILAGTGIILNNSSKIKKTTSKLNNLSVDFGAAPRQGRITLTYRF